jgi:hypothetical protein
LGVTGLSPATVNAVPAALVGRAEAVGLVGSAETVGRAEAVGLAEAVVVTGAGPVGVGVAEHPADSAATAHRTATAAAGRATLVI